MLPGGRRRLKKLVQERGRRLRKVKLASLNVGSMTGRSGEIVQLMRKKSLQVLCVQETKWKGSEAREIGVATSYTITEKKGRRMEWESY